MSRSIHLPMDLLPETRQRLARQIRDLCGIVLGPDKDYLIHHRVVPLARKNRCKTLEEFCNRLDSVTAVKLRGALIEAVTTHETSFFRDTHPWEALRKTILPNLLNRPGRQGKLRLWSAACATGQEAWSLAMAATEACELTGRNASEEVLILATDISEAILEVCRKGVYSAQDVRRGLDPIRQGKYFLEKPEGFEVGCKLKSLVRWQKLNLLESLIGQGKFDLILCRNVLIYFDEATRRKLIESLAERLEAHGYLLVGAAESLYGLSPMVVQESIGSTLAYRPSRS